MTVKWCAIVFLGLMLFFGQITSVAASAYEEMPALKIGMSGTTVLQMQKMLQAAGFYHDLLDGRYGVNTQQSVILFQQSYGLDADGVVGARTWQALRTPLAPSRAIRDDGSRKGPQIVAQAMKFNGVPYVWGGRSPAGFDCSGFVSYLCDVNGVTVPRMADEQFQAGVSVGLTSLQPGDLVFYSTYLPGPSHVGIYIGNGAFIHASSAAKQVTVTPMSKPYYQDRYLGARRIVR